MKKIFLGILLGMSMIICGCSNGGGNNNENIVTNYFNGEGELHSYSEHNRRPILYDDKYKYMIVNLLGYCCFDGSKVYSACDDATCKHTDRSCKVSNWNIYFVLDKTLYCGDNEIINIETGEVVYDNEMPQEYEQIKEDKYFVVIDDQITPATTVYYNNRIDQINIIDNKYIVLREGGYCMVLDTNFKEITHFNDISVSSWYSIKDNYLYFLNDYWKIEKVSLIDGKTENLDLGIEYINRAYDNEKYWFVSDQYQDLYRIDKGTKEKKKLASGVADIFANDKYIYFMNMDETNEIYQIIMDMDGNIVKKINEDEELGVNMDIAFASCYDDKLYINASPIDDVNGNVLVEMSLDGSEIKKYEIQD